MKIFKNMIDTEINSALSKLSSPSYVTEEQGAELNKKIIKNEINLGVTTNALNTLQDKLEPLIKLESELLCAELINKAQIDALSNMKWHEILSKKKRNKILTEAKDKAWEEIKKTSKKDLTNK